MLADVDSMRLRRQNGALVRRLAHVVSVGAGGFNAQTEMRRLLALQFAEHAFRRGRAANVAHADHKHTDITVFHGEKPAFSSLCLVLGNTGSIIRIRRVGSLTKTDSPCSAS